MLGSNQNIEVVCLRAGPWWREYERAHSGSYFDNLAFLCAFSIYKSIGWPIDAPFARIAAANAIEVRKFSCWLFKLEDIRGDWN